MFSPTSLLSALPSFPSFPALPAVPLPKNVQHRLVAFLLRRALGAFVREDGWADEDGKGEGGRVEADVRAGRVRVRDLEVDPKAINSLLGSSSSSSESGVESAPPIELVSGRLSSVTANVGYPSLSLSAFGGDAKLDLEVDGVELVFRVRDAVDVKVEGMEHEEEKKEREVPTRPGKGQRTMSEASTSSSFSTSSASTTTTNEHSSTALPHPSPHALSLSLAHSFLSSAALSPAEESQLRSSLHLPPGRPSISGSVDLPGAFGGARPPAGAEGGGGAVVEEEQVEEVEAGLLAGVVERILARLSVKVRRVVVKVVWAGRGGEKEGEYELRLEVDEVGYLGASAAIALEGAAPASAGARSLSVSPPRVYLKSPVPPAASRSTPASPSSSAPSTPSASFSAQPPHSFSRSRSSSSSSSDDSTDSAPSSGDESDFLAMSQSIADLRTSTASLSLSRSSLGGGRGAGESAMFRSAREFGSVAEEPEPTEGDGEEEDPFHDPDNGDEEGDEAFATPQGSPAQGQKSLPQQSELPPSGSTAAQDEIFSEAEDETEKEQDKGVLIFSLGSPSADAEPLVFALSSPPAALSSASAIPFSAVQKPLPLLFADLSQGWVVALSAAQVGTLVEVAGRFSPSSSSAADEGGSRTAPGGGSGAGGLGVQLNVRLSSVDVFVAYPSTPLPDTAAYDVRFWSSSSCRSPDAPHFHLRLSELSLSTITASTSSTSRTSPITSGLAFCVSSLTLSETSSTKRTLPLLISDPLLPRPGANEEVEAIDWVRLVAGEAVEGGERWTKEGRYVGRKSRRERKGGKNEREEPHAKEPAVAVEIPLAGGGGGVDVKLAPMHAFLDMTVLERVKALVEAMHLPSSSSAAAKSPSSPPARTPRPSTPTPAKRNILDDLDFPFSSPNPATNGRGVTMTCPLFRLSLHCPAPTSLSSSDPLGLRSGRLLIDLSDLTLSSSSGSSTHATTTELSLFFAPLSSSRGRRIARIAPLVPHAEDDSVTIPSLSFSTIGGAAPEVVLVVPLVHAQLDKPALDGVQLLADDVAQFFAAQSRASSFEEGSETRGGPRGEREKILGSRYFAKSGRRGEEEMEGSTATIRGGGGEYAAGREKGRRTLMVKVDVTDVIVDLLVDRLPPLASTVAEEPASKRHLRVVGSDLSAAVELIEDGEDDLRAGVSLMDVKIEDATASSSSSPAAKRILLARTLPRNLVSPTLPSPVLSVDFASATEPGTSVKESKVMLGVENLTVHLRAEDVKLVEEVAAFAKAPEGAFEDVVPTDLTAVRLNLDTVSFNLAAPTLPSQLVLTLSTLSLRTDLVPDLPRTTIDVDVGGARVWAIDSEADLKEGSGAGARDEGEWCKSKGFVQLVEVEKADVGVKVGNGLVLPDLDLVVSDAKIDVALCADTVASVARFAKDLASAEVFQANKTRPSPFSSTRRPPARRTPADLLASVDPTVFERAPSLRDMPEILDDDVPTNLDYLADALNQTSGPPKKHRRGASSISSSFSGGDGQALGELISEVDGETIRMLSPRGVEIVDEWLAEPRVDEKDYSAPASKIRCRLNNADVAFHLHAGYDWFTTRKAIEEENKAIRRRLEKIRQLLASGQTPDASAEKDASVHMFGSLQLGLPPGASELTPRDLLAAINEELDDSPNSDAASTTSTWQTFPGRGGSSSSSARRPAPAIVGKARKKLTRSRTFAVEVNLRGVSASFDSYSAAPASSHGRSMYTSMLLPTARSQLASKLAVDVSSLDIIDNIKTSTWRKFLTELRLNDGGNVRATGAPMAKVELSAVRPIEGVMDAREEILLKIKVSPLRLYIDQDALDFLKAFGAFELPSPSPASSPAPAPSAKSEPFFQRVEVFPVKIKLDYKPKRVDYAALRNGKTAELMNFFHFDGSEMTLRHLVVTGVSGTSTLSTLVQDIWTPDVKAHQLADVISGIAPVRSVVTVGAGVANLVLLPIEQYRKDGRVVRGLQKGAQAFAKQTTLEAINVGAKLATGTQVILEQAEHVLGAKFDSPIAAETVQPFSTSTSRTAEREGRSAEELSDKEKEIRSRYADQPSNVKQGVESAYRSLKENVKEAAQTILAVPMEVYERSASEGPVKAVVRAVPIAVLKPMIGASGAVSKALLGLRNTLDPDAQQGELEDKYKAASARRG